MVKATNSSLMTLDGTRTYIVGSKRAVVIDPGPDDVGHVDALVAELAGAESIDIVITHHHADHAGAAPALAARTDGRARVWAMGSRPDWTSTPVQGLADGDAFETDHGCLTVVATPGHTADHIALVWDRPSGGRAMFVGDVLLGEGDTTLVAAPEGDVGDYLRSLDRLEALGAERLYPTHGDPLTAPAAAIGRFRHHRLERVDQVRKVLSADPRATTSDIVGRLYGSALPAAIQDAASASIEAVRSYLRTSARE